MEKSYLHECWYCNEYIVESGPYPKERSFHEECKERYLIEKEETKTEYIRLKVEVMFERALRTIEKQDYGSISEYKEAADAVHELAQRDSNKFASSHEMVAAMELIRNRVKTKVQYPINRRRVDMLLPELKVALEIDGNLHKFRIGKDSDRDIEIMNYLNENDNGWEVIRIPTIFIEKNITKLVPSIKQLYKERQELRRKHNGFLPSYYSSHNRSSQLKALEGINDKTKYSLKE